MATLYTLVFGADMVVRPKDCRVGGQVVEVLCTLVRIGRWTALFCPYFVFSSFFLSGQRAGVSDM